MTPTRKRLVCSFLLCMGIFSLFVFIINWITNFPIVYESWSTGACVKMEINEKIIPCNVRILNQRYIHIWVE